MTILVNDDTIKNNENKSGNKEVKTILGHNIVKIELVSDEDPFESLKKYMREDSWYWEYNNDY